MSENLIERLRGIHNPISEEAVDTLRKLEKELEVVYADRNFYKLKSESLEESLEKEKQAHMETVGAYHDADEELARLIKVAREK